MLRGERQRLLWLIAPALPTLVLICRTFWYFFASVGNVPWSDLWPMLSEVRSFRSGQSEWSYLYSTFWGNRPLVPRLFIYVSARFLHYSGWSFVVITLTAQVAMLLVVLWLLRRAFPERGTVYWLSTIAAVNLLLSSLQMEVFMEGLNIEYTIGYGSAVAAIALSGLPWRPSSKPELRFWIAVLLGAVSSGCFAIGLAVFPMMIIGMWLARGPVRYIAITFTVAAVLAVTFSMGYARPSMGMGIGGAIHRPLQALRIVALVLGGPVTLYSRSLGVAAGAIGILTAAAVLFRIARDPALRVTPGVVSLTMIAWFMIASAASVMAGRLSPEWLARTIYTLPSRYLHPTLVFWAVLFPIAFLYLPHGIPWRIAAFAVALITLMCAFGTWNWQWYLPRDWAIVNEHLDAVASGFILDVADPPILDNVYPPPLRNNVVDYMREQHLSVFHEPRSHWPGRNVMSIAPPDDRSTCRAVIRTVDALGSGTAFRVTGNLVVDGQTPRRRLDVLFADSAGVVKGLARTLPIFSERAPAADFFGYTVGIPPNQTRIFALSSGRMIRCAM
jgi:hypothetical protein